MLLRSPNSAASFVGRYVRGMQGQLDEPGSGESSRMRLLWAQGLERPPVATLLDPFLFLSENHPSVEEEGGPGMLRAGNHAREVGGTRKTGQCWVTSSCPSVLSSSIPERETHTDRDSSQNTRQGGRKEGQKTEGGMGRESPRGK